MPTLQELQAHHAARVAEVESYQTNITNYEMMLLALPSEWPADLLEYKGMNPHDIPKRIDDPAIQMTVADLLFADDLHKRVVTEKIEQRKAVLIRDVLAQQIAAMGG